MKPFVDRSRVEQLVRSALSELGRPASGALDRPVGFALDRPVGFALDRPVGFASEGGGALLLKPDRGHNLQPFDPEAMRAMLASTPARIGVGRAGTRYRTNTLLKFRADHAAAKDAVTSEVDARLVEKLGLVELHTQAPDKRVFLQRPDLGRALSDESKRLLAERCDKSPQLQICYGDGLSAAALNAHLEAFHGALLRALQQKSIRVGTPVFVRHSRVKVMDEIARLLDAEACVFTCGERPGLGFSDSMSAYYIYSHGILAASGATDADREVVSNINPRGLEPTRAAEAVAGNCARVLAAKKSGVVI